MITCILMLILSQIPTGEAPSTCFIVIFTCLHHSLSPFYFVAEYMQNLVFFPCSSLGISCFAKDSWFLLIGNDIFRTKNWGEGRYAHCYWGIFASRSYEQTDLGKSICTYILIYINMHQKRTHMDLYPCIFPVISTY